MRRLTSVLLAFAVMLGAVSGCGGGSDAKTLNVFAAASLTDSFGALERTFEAQHQGVDVRINAAGSQTLVAQIEQGAKADVIATASTKSMDGLAADGRLDGAAVPFVTNALEIAVRAGNPDNITGLSDLARSGLRVVIPAPEVPAGQYGREALSRAGVDLKPVSEPNDVKAAVTPVALGEADASIVYATDVRAAGAQVAGVPIPADQNVVATYPIAVVKDVDAPDLARQFVDLVRSADGQRTLTDAGFGAAPAPG